MRSIVVLVFIALSLTFIYPSGARAESSPHWTRCVLTFGNKGGFQHKTCYHVPMPNEHRQRTGHWWAITKRTATRQVRITYPTFAVPQPAAPVAPSVPAHQVMYFPVTGYSWGCGTPNGITASGTVPAVGTVASNVLPLGAHVYVPSLGYYGVVLDRGAPLDLFAANCAATYAYTGYRAVEVW